MEKKIKQVDFKDYYTPTDFDSTEIKEEIKKIEKEIKLVLDGAKINPEKMLTIFNMQKAAKTFCQTAYPKVGFWTFPNKLDIFRAGIIYGSMAHSIDKTTLTK